MRQASQVVNKVIRLADRASAFVFRHQRLKDGVGDRRPLPIVYILALAFSPIRPIHDP